MNEVKALARRKLLGSKLNWARVSPSTGDFGRCTPSCSISARRGSFRAKTTSALRGTVEILKSDKKGAPKLAPQRKEDLGAVDELSQESSRERSS